MVSVLDEEETGTYPNSWTAQLKSALSILLDVLLAFWMEPCRWGRVEPPEVIIELQNVTVYFRVVHFRDFPKVGDDCGVILFLTPWFWLCEPTNLLSASLWQVELLYRGFLLLSDGLQEFLVNGAAWNTTSIRTYKIFASHELDVL